MGGRCGGPSLICQKSPPASLEQALDSKESDIHDCSLAVDPRCPNQHHCGDPHRGDTEHQANGYSKSTHLTPPVAVKDSCLTFPTYYTHTAGILFTGMLK
jgi:hypothetical protein